MNKLRVIDLLNKIANGEEVPKKIKYHNDIHILQKSNSTKPLNCYYCKESHCHLFGTFYDYDLNDEVEVIEKKKIPEKLEDYDFDDDFDANTKCECLRERMFEIEDKINKIIDYLEENK